MACEIDSGRLDFSCRTSIGGLKNIYITRGFSNDLRANSTITAGVITALTNPVNVYKFELMGDSNTFDQAPEGSRANGTSLFVPTGAFTLKKQDNLTTELMESLSKGRFQVIIESNNGDFQLAGFDNGVDFSIATTSGGAFDSINGYNVTFTGREANLAPFVDKAIVSAEATTGFAVQATDISPS